MKPAPPLEPTSYGNFQMLPMPTAEPTVASRKPTRPDHASGVFVIAASAVAPLSDQDQPALVSNRSSIAARSPGLGNKEVCAPSCNGLRSTARQRMWHTPAASLTEIKPRFWRTFVRLLVAYVVASLIWRK